MIFPNYLRELFYDTGDLFPDFMMNFGSGQSIYTISYYGLYNPLVMLSYLFPFIPMYNYIMIMMYGVVVSSAILFYIYLRKNNRSVITSSLLGFCMLCSSPLLFHAHKHIMYISYMPFIVLGMYGVDKYINKNRSYLLIISLSMIIFSSYYFSIPGFLILFGFGIYRYIEKEGFHFKDTFKFSVKYIVPFAIAGFSSALLLFPTISTMIGGRLSIVSQVEVWELFIPQITILYRYDSIGVTLVPVICIVIALIMCPKIDKIFISLILMLTTFPIFNFILNGFMYSHFKPFITLIPFFLYFSSKGMEIIFKTSIKKIAVITYTIVSATTICLFLSLDDSLVNKDEYLNQLDTYEKLHNALDFDSSFYRINDQTDVYRFPNAISNIDEYKTSMYSSSVNTDYYYFINDVMSSNVQSTYRFMINPSSNPFIQSYLSEKYIYTKDKLGLGYKFIGCVDDINIYENINVLSLGYATTSLININQFDDLHYTQRIANLVGSAVTNYDTNSDIITTTKLDISRDLDLSTIDYEIVDEKIKIMENDFTINFNYDTTGKIIFLKFDLETSSQKKNVYINNQHNGLSNSSTKYHNTNTSFEFCFIEPSNLDILIDINELEIFNVELHSMDYSDYVNKITSVDNFNVDTNKTNGDYIFGDITVSEDSYFTLSVPYDDGFKILVDGIETEYELANKSFIGFEITEGYHKIEIEYKDPIKNISMIITLISICCAGLLTYYEVKKYRKK